MKQTMNQPLDEKTLRKAWLKKRFASWEYHEELLRLHDEYLTALHRHWARSEIQKQYPDDYKAMQSPVFLNFDRVQKPGEITKSAWDSKPTVGWADAIPYNFNKGMDFAGCNEYAGVADAEREHLNKLVGLMLEQSENIRRTVENTWEKHSPDSILNEEYTGSISWPTNWREDLLGASGAALLAAQAPRIKAGEPVPQDGLWQAVDSSNRQQRSRAGQTLPDLGSAYGITVWQRLSE